MTTTTALNTRSINVEGIAVSQITIDEEFKSLIPPLTEIERLQLEDNLTREGCRDPLVVWKNAGILIDGHNRFEICERNNIPFDVQEIGFESRDKAKDWILRTQLGRRNLTPTDAELLRGHIYNGRKKMKGGDRKSKGQNDPLISTAAAVGKETGFSEKTIKRNGQLAEAVDKVAKIVPDVVAKVRSGKAKKADVVAAAKVVESDPETAKQIVSGAKQAAKAKQAESAAKWITTIRKHVESRIPCDLNTLIAECMVMVPLHAARRTSRESVARNCIITRFQKWLNVDSSGIVRRNDEQATESDIVANDAETISIDPDVVRAWQNAMQRALNVDRISTQKFVESVGKNATDIRKCLTAVVACSHYAVQKLDNDCWRVRVGRNIPFPGKRLSAEQKAENARAEYRSPFQTMVAKAKTLPPMSRTEFFEALGCDERWFMEILHEVTYITLQEHDGGAVQLVVEQGDQDVIKFISHQLDLLTDACPNGFSFDPKRVGAVIRRSWAAIDKATAKADSSGANTANV